MTNRNQPRLATRAVRAGLESDTQYGAVVPPIYLSSNFAFSPASTLASAPEYSS